MANPSLLFLQHPLGDPSTLPCTHFELDHPNGHQVRVPCTHGFRQQHPEGDVVQTIIGPVTAPCVHLETIHPLGDTVTVACGHVVVKHPEGHPGPSLPCVHPMPVLRSEFDGSLLFYTADEEIQEITMDAIARLEFFGVSLITPLRPLQIFHRASLDDGSGEDPFWSHYSPLYHSVQVKRTPGMSLESKRNTLHHELGHALIGNTLVNHFAGGSHQLTKPADNFALAMSEGWAHFVALILQFSSREAKPDYRNLDWESISVEPNGKVEYCVGAFLWDLFDLTSLFDVMKNENPLRRGRADDAVTLRFEQIFSVYSPNLSALIHGPWISSVWDFADRLKLVVNAEGLLAERIDETLLANCGARPSLGFLHP